MLIRAYRIRGHLAADLDPLAMRDVSDAKNSLEPNNYGFSDTDMDRPIFIDNVLGLQIATMRQIVEIVQELIVEHLLYSTCIYPIQSSQHGSKNG